MLALVEALVLADVLALIFCSILSLFPAFSSLMASSILSKTSSLSPPLFPLLALLMRVLADSSNGSGSSAFLAAWSSSRALRC